MLRSPLVVALVLAACAPLETASDAGIETDDAAGASSDAGSPTEDAAIATPFRPELEADRWERVRDDLPSAVWETGVAYEPRIGALIEHGGHLLSSYAQTPYTWRYDLRADALVEALPSTRPMRRCIVELAWMDGPERIVTVQGSASHGSLPPGWLSGWRVTRSDQRGPWLYDALGDRWEHMRPTGTQWPQRSHAGVAYDATSDALYVVGGDGLYAYVPHANEVRRLPLPAALARRQGYAIGVDPDARRLVIFGGASRHWTYGHIDGDETDNCGVVDEATCASYYRAYVHADTWVLDIDAAARAGWSGEGEVPAGWSQLTEGARPPRGMPMWNHQRLSLVWHAPSGRLLLLANAIDDAPIMSAAAWPPVELWSFDAESLRWERHETADPPHFAGLPTYAPELDVLAVWGGGERGERAAEDSSATGSRTLYLMRPSLGAERRAGASVPRVSASARDASTVEARFATEPGRRYELQRAPATPLAGAYEPLVTVTATERETVVLDTDAGTSMHAYRARELGTSRWSLPGFDAPRPPTGVRATPRLATRVELAWEPVVNARGYRVYRSGPGESLTRVGETVETSLADTSIDLTDGLSRIYVVSATDIAGRESGKSPMAFTVPDAPVALDVRERDDGRFEVRWEPRDPEERLALFYLDYHCNARASIEEYLDAFVPVGELVGAGSAVVSAPEVDPSTRDIAPLAEPGECGRTLREGHYFYGRVVSPLGQQGLYSDIVSPADPRFRAALPERE